MCKLCPSQRKKLLQLVRDRGQHEEGGGLVDGIQPNSHCVQCVLSTTRSRGGHESYWEGRRYRVQRGDPWKGGDQRGDGGINAGRRAVYQRGLA